MEWDSDVYLFRDQRHAAGVAAAYSRPRLPRLPTDRIRRERACATRDETRALPLVVVAKLANALRLTALDDRADAEGLSPGMALTDARAIVPPLDVMAHDEDADRRLLAAIADWCERFTPLWRSTCRTGFSRHHRLRAFIRRRSGNAANAVQSCARAGNFAARQRLPVPRLPQARSRVARVK